MANLFEFFQMSEADESSKNGIIVVGVKSVVDKLEQLINSTQLVFNDDGNDRKLASIKSSISSEGTQEVALQFWYEEKEDGKYIVVGEKLDVDKYKGFARNGQLIFHSPKQKDWLAKNYSSADMEADGHRQLVIPVVP